MRILHAITGLAEAAGTSVFVAGIVRALAERGHRCGIAVCGGAGRIPPAFPLPDGVAIVDLDALSDGRPDGATGCGLSDWDFVHIHALWSPVLHRLARQLAARKIPYATSPHGMLAPWALAHKKWKKRLAMLAYQRRDLANAAFLHATAQPEADRIRELGFSNPVAIAPLGVDLPDSTCRSAGILPATSESMRTILYLGRLHRVKGLMNLVEAWAKVRREGWRVVLAGPDEENHRAELEQLAERLGVRGDISFPGVVSGADKWRLLAGADFFVLPSFTENFGAVAAESLAAGVPVVATKGTPWRELEERRCGRWVDVGSAPLAAAMSELMALPKPELEAMGLRGRALVGEKSWDASAAILESAYRKHAAVRVKF